MYSSESGQWAIHLVSVWYMLMPDIFAENCIYVLMQSPFENREKEMCKLEPVTLYAWNTLYSPTYRKDIVKQSI